MRSPDILQCTGWSINLDARHPAHHSGLVAYFDPVSTPSGAIRCIGPLSLCSTDLDLRQVQRRVLALTLELERVLASDSIYCIWGSYTLQTQFQDHLTDILGLEHSFVPNATLKSSLLLSSEHRDRSIHLEREWSLDPSGNRVTHASGLEFQFERSRKKFRRWRCQVRRTDSSDAPTMHPNLSLAVIGTLSSIALCPLELNTNKPNVLRNRNIIVSIGSDLFKWNPVGR